MSQTDEEWCHRIHERLLAGDPTASAELMERVANTILEKLERNYPREKLPRLDSETLKDIFRTACFDGIAGYLKRPAAFDPRKRGLVGYLVMAAEGDLKNALRKFRGQPEAHLDEDVELGVLSGNRSDEREHEARMDLDRIFDRLFTNAADRRAAQMMFVEGERSTSAFAEVWGWSNLRIREQRIEVKRAKDRLKKVLERRAKELRERER